MTSLPSLVLNINYEQQKDTLRSFFQDYMATPDLGEDTLMVDENSFPKYMRLLQDVANREPGSDKFEVDLDDLFKYEQTIKTSNSKYIVDHITENTAHYMDIICEILDQIMPAPTKELNYNSEVLDVIIHQRLERNRRLEQETQESQDAQYSPQAHDMFPAALTRRYNLYLKPMSKLSRQTAGQSLAVREVKGEHLGRLITIRGIITRVSDVRPSVVVQAYTCDKCGNEVFQEVKSKNFTPLVECPSEECKNNNFKGQLFTSTRASKFLPFQDVRIQELADQVPTGQVPRSLTIFLKGPITRSVSPGDLVDLTGVFLPRPYTGFKALKAGLLTDTYLETMHVNQHKKQYAQLSSSADLDAKVDEIHNTGNAYNMLASSIAPEIFGHADVKRALLLLLVGGCTKEIGDGMKIRGDINICLMGDPGVAKSQLLKYISKVAPRGVYTTGRGSSGVGLTAAVIRDPVSEEMILEGGALVLADNGVCCIDEFDKMDDSDRTAIHEVMEQQTISIAKAGMATTLNARASILAAANPIYGRYNPKVDPVKNINLPAALLSRFDLLFLLLDVPNKDSDAMLARHVTYVHTHSAAPDAAHNTIETDVLRQFIAKAREFRPVLPTDVADFAIDAYVQMRQREAQNAAENRSKASFGHVTPRQLLGILRMAQARARIDFSHTVTREHVEEALRLHTASKESLTNTSSNHTYEDPVVRCYKTIVEILQTEQDHRKMLIEVQNQVLGAGITQKIWEDTLHTYERTNTLRLDGNWLELVDDSMAP